MLPGFRFLFATIVLSISVLIFGLGAAALLRAAHEEFANPPAWRLAQPQFPNPQFPGQPVDTGTPVLAMLRMDSLPAKKDAPETKDDIQPAALAASDGAPQDATPDRPDVMAAEPAPAAEVKPAAEIAPEATQPVEDKVASVDTQAMPEAEAAATSPAPETTASVPVPESSAENGNPENKPPETRLSAIDSAAPGPSAINSVSDSDIKTTFEIRVQANRHPKHAVRKAKRPSITAAQRRRAAAHARAMARARAEQIAQQRLAEIYPLAQLFGVGVQQPQVQSTPPQP